MSQFLTKRLSSLESHLASENPALLEVLPTYYKLDKILYGLGLLDRESSLATKISWWPLVAVLGTFSSGKSTFINAYIGEKIQDTGNQAVDDKFTVITYRSAATASNHTLPGSALDADPRFPFYRISGEIEKVARGEGKRIESYLQLRTSHSEKLKSKIIIDSPGFDADDQRRSTLRITDHIIDLSDLVLVFFDARHPEPGAMQDTLEHLVKRTVERADTSKFFYVLNQIDTAAREDNPEEVFGAWQRSIAQAGLASGKFFTIYNEEASIPIEDEALRARFRARRDNDLAQITKRMDEVEIQRNYRVVGVLENVANQLEHEVLPRLMEAKRKWRRRVLIGDGLVLGALAAALIALSVKMGWSLPEGLFSLEGFIAHRWDVLIAAIGAAIVIGATHGWMRGLVRKRLARKLPEAEGPAELNLRAGFLRTTSWRGSVFSPTPVGWSKRIARRLQAIRDTVATHIQSLNDLYADPSGKGDAAPEAKAAAEAETLTETRATAEAETEAESMTEPTANGETGDRGKAP